MSLKRAGPPSSPATRAIQPVRIPPGAAGYLTRIRDSFLGAEGPGARRLEVVLGGRVVALRFAGTALHEALSPAFAHLRAAPAEADPELAISIWDDESSPVAPPPIPWSPSDIGAIGDVSVFSQDPVRVATDAESGAITVVDLVRREAFFHVPAASRLAWSEAAAPLRPALNWLLGTRGIALVHGGAVGAEGRGVVLAGRGGSGKSTLAAAALLRGMEFAGDDYVALTCDPAPTAHSVHATLKLADDSLAMLSLDQLGGERDPVHEKTALYPLDWASASVVDRLEVSAIVVPRRDGKAAALTPISGAEGLRALAPSTLFQLPGRDVDSLAAMAELARAVPSYSISLDGNPEAAAAELERLVRRDG